MESARARSSHGTTAAATRASRRQPRRLEHRSRVSSSNTQNAETQETGASPHHSLASSERRSVATCVCQEKQVLGQSSHNDSKRRSKGFKGQ